MPDIRTKLRAHGGLFWTFLKGLKRSLRLAELLNYKAALISARAISRNARSRRKCILIVGDAPPKSGPYFFVANITILLKDEYHIVFSFSSRQASSDLAAFCRENGIDLSFRPVLPDFLDAIFVEFIIQFKKASILIVNAATFSRNVHLLAVRIPTLYYSHSIWCRPISKKTQWTLDKFIGGNHRVIAVSKAAHELYCKLYFRNEMKKHVSWIHNFVPERFQERLPIIPERRIIVLTLGSVTSYKNPELWVRVGKRVLQSCGNLNIEFWWAGEGPLLFEVKRACANDERIRFLGFSKNPQTLYSQASIYFQPSEFENCSLSVGEAMMFGLPCVVTDCGGLPEQVSDDVNGYTIPENREDIMVQRILELAQNEQKRREMGFHSRERFLDHFTAKRWRTSFEKILQEIGS